MSAAVELAGFADPVIESQVTFRAVLDAMARPGRLHRAGERMTAPKPLDPATAATLLTLVDNETPLWLDDAAAMARDWLAFHCGAVVIASPARAAFAAALSLPDLTALPAGSHEAPEDAATLVLQVAALGTGVRYRLSGPGLRAPELLAVQGLPPCFAEDWRRNHRLFPRGIDIILCAGTTLTALPRSVAIEEA